MFILLSWLKRNRYREVNVKFYHIPFPADLFIASLWGEIRQQNFSSSSAPCAVVTFIVTSHSFESNSILKVERILYMLWNLWCNFISFEIGREMEPLGGKETVSSLTPVVKSSIEFRLDLWLAAIVIMEILSYKLLPKQEELLKRCQKSRRGSLHSFLSIQLDLKASPSNLFERRT